MISILLSNLTHPASSQTRKRGVLLSGSLLLLFTLISTAHASTWYVRSDGGTRFSAKMPAGQCDGLADAPYPGHGTNRHCAFNDVRFFWQDGSYTTLNTQAAFPSYGWIGAGGDTFLIRGDKPYRIGWNNPRSAGEATQLWGVQGDPYGSGAPAPLSGTPAAHTRILGEHFASCASPAARAHLHGGFGVNVVLLMSGVSYVDVACIDITDHSACGRANQVNQCNTTPGTLTDHALNGVSWSRASTHDTLTDVSIHGMASAGMIGPTGDSVTFRGLSLIGNAASGWNADSGDGATGTGTLLVQHYRIAWNGCAEQYPLRDPQPFADCTDDNAGGYGDGFGTATAESRPAWNVTFDDGEVFYNTQDGLDALHLSGPGSSMTVAHTLAYGNMGQQIKVGGASGIVLDNRITTSCNALRGSIPGTPAGFNTRLTDFCRAADAGILLTVNDQIPLRFERNLIASASATAIEIDCAAAKCGRASRIVFRDNVFLGFRNDAAHGYKNGGSGDLSNPIYLGAGTNPFTNPGSTYTGNTTIHPRANWKCPAPGESHANCTDPHLPDQSWHPFGPSIPHP